MKASVLFKDGSSSVSQPIRFPAWNSPALLRNEARNIHSLRGQIERRKRGRPKIGRGLPENYESVPVAWARR